MDLPQKKVFQISNQFPNAPAKAHLAARDYQPGRWLVGIDKPTPEEVGLIQLTLLKIILYYTLIILEPTLKSLKWYRILTS